MRIDLRMHDISETLFSVNICIYVSMDISTYLSYYILMCIYVHIYMHTTSFSPLIGKLDK